MSLLTFCQYQLSVVGKQQNNLILKPEVCNELYTEIVKVLPSLEYCLAPKKNKEASGGSSLRSQVSQTVTSLIAIPTSLIGTPRYCMSGLIKRNGHTFV